MLELQPHHQSPVAAACKNSRSRKEHGRRPANWKKDSCVSGTAGSASGLFVPGAAPLVQATLLPSLLRCDGLSPPTTPDLTNARCNKRCVAACEVVRSDWRPVGWLLTRESDAVHRSCKYETHGSGGAAGGQQTGGGHGGLSARLVLGDRWSNWAVAASLAVSSVSSLVKRGGGASVCPSEASTLTSKSDANFPIPRFTWLTFDPPLSSEGPPTSSRRGRSTSHL